MGQYETTAAEPSGWATGGTVFAATLMMMVGVFQALSGLAAILDDQFYVVTRNYTFDLDVTAWGWIHLILGILVALSGFYLLLRRPWAAIVAITLAVFSAISQFFFVPYYPWWALLIISLNVFVIWAITRPGVIRA
jgi:hypothetical protein